MGIIINKLSWTIYSVEFVCFFFNPRFSPPLLSFLHSSQLAMMFVQVLENYSSSLVLQNKHRDDVPFGRVTVESGWKNDSPLHLGHSLDIGTCEMETDRSEEVSNEDSCDELVDKEPQLKKRGIVNRIVFNSKAMKMIGNARIHWRYSTKSGPGQSLKEPVLYYNHEEVTNLIK